MNTELLFQEARAELLKTGKQTPMLFVEFTDQTEACLILSGFPSGLMRQRETLFVIGRKTGKEMAGKSIAQLCLFIEAWAREQIVGAAQVSDRMEVLAMHVLQVKAPKEEAPRHTLHITQMIRDSSGKLVELVPHDEPMEVRSGVLESFLAGFASTEMPDEDFEEMVAWAAKQAAKYAEKARKKAEKRAKKGKKQ